MASPERDRSRCRQRDIIRVPLKSDDKLRALGVCTRCGAFRDVTGLPTSEVYRAIHEQPEIVADEEPLVRHVTS